MRATTVGGPPPTDSITTVAVFSGWQGMAQRLLAGTEFESDEDHGGRSEMSMIDTRISESPKVKLLGAT